MPIRWNDATLRENASYGGEQMQVTGTEDVAAPIEHVFEELTAFDALERQALRRGIDVRRQFRGGAPTLGEGWEAQFKFRGKDRTAKITLDAYDAPNMVQFGGASGGLETNTLIELVPLSPNRTRVSVVFKMFPKTLSARLLVQSFKLARSNINKRFKKRMSQFAREIEARVVRNA
ncbi:MAG: SRPBCC family protein [Marivita sp.]|uniref:SRPBCC family protein n=1 Tax=Marivita sp. TaxID=2003365 RepID=UPI0025BA4DC6|nr:SRPBCC family protein [Marivita sp.]MCI5110292.1 SRPBCC family protein [Marivita sp.]